MLKNGQSLDEIAKKVGISSLKLGGVIEQLNTRGYNIIIVDNKVVVKKSKNKNNKFIKPNMSELKKIRQLWISDTHLCNEAQQLNLLNKVYKEAYDRGIDTVLHF